LSEKQKYFLQYGNVFYLYTIKLKIVQSCKNSTNMKSISNETEYNAIVKRIDQLLEIVTDENYHTIPEAVELDFLSNLVADYEDANYPVTPPSLPDVLRLRMYEMGLNQNKLSELLEVSPSRVSEYLTGKSEPTLSVARNICRKLHINSSVVLGV
jgi:HTH-type transcriptional regulator/antitoxin HigA